MEGVCCPLQPTKVLPGFEAPSPKILVIDLCTVTITVSTMTTVLVSFKMDGVLMEMWGSARVEEIFLQGDEKPTLIITLKKPAIEKVELPPEEVALEDSLEGNH